eukprot:CAMPEP_0171324438 /NCGR_PEP_ID=MMETSP0816-20121228/116180_1 /TAXON_ID=420281 /ORGANISM="Proboscia inermis, Strain CCAP1064/1" /LENGTH=34 /DNA_ID= /DNA_START= /DNA_END= /DNA_ORIENTATION=
MEGLKHLKKKHVIIVDTSRWHFHETVLCWEDAGD